MSDGDKIILVAGATGQQGGAVTRQLLADGWRVRALTRDPNSPRRRSCRGRVPRLWRATWTIARRWTQH